MAGILSGDASTAGGGSANASGKLEEPDHSSSNWYFAREEIERHSPSRKDSIDLKKETYFRKSYCTFLQDLGMRLKVPQVTIATAIVFCHRFFLRQSHLKNDRLTIATICMFLAGKVEETPRGLVDVILMSYEIRFKKDSAAIQRVKSKRQEVIEEQKELVLVGERLVLTTLGFDLNIHHPYKPLVAAIKKFKVAQNALAQVAWNFVNDGLRTSLCLQFKPHHIAAGAIFLAAKFLKVKLPSDGEKVWWQEFEVTPRQLEEVSNQMLELYEQNKAGGIVGPGAGSKSDPSISVGITKTGLATASHDRILKVEDGPATSRMDDYEGHSARHSVGTTKTGQAAPSHERINKLEEGPATSRMDDYEGHSGRHTPAAKSEKLANGVADTKMANGHHASSRPSAAVEVEDGAASPRTDDDYEAHSARYTGSVSNPDKQNNGVADVNMEPSEGEPRQASGNGELKDGERHADGELKVKSESVSVKPEVVEEDRKSWGGLEDNKDKDSERSKHDRRGKAKHPPHRVEQMDAVPERGEDGELPTTSAQEPSRSPRPAERRTSMTTSAERSASPSSQKRRWESREPHRGRDGGSHDKWGADTTRSGGTSTYRHGGHNRNDGHYHHSNSYPHHQYRQEGDREQRYHTRDRDWERDHKKPRHEHGQY